MALWIKYLLAFGALACLVMVPVFAFSDASFIETGGASIQGGTRMILRWETIVSGILSIAFSLLYSMVPRKPSK